MLAALQESRAWLRHGRIGLATAVALSLLALRSSGQTIVRKLDTPRVLDLAITLAPDSFSLATVEGVARRYLSQDRKGHRILRLTMAADRLVLARALYKGRSDTTFQSLLDGIRRVGLPSGPVARLLSIGDASVPSYRDATGYSERILTGDRDPRVQRVDGFEFQLLHFRIQEMRQSPTAPIEQPYVASFFLETHGKVSIAACASVTRQLAHLFGISYSVVAVRTIPWFVEDPEFPEVFPFVEKIFIPQKGEYYLLPSVRCSEHPTRGLRCSGQNFVP